MQRFNKDLVLKIILKNLKSNKKKLEIVIRKVLRSLRVTYTIEI